MFKIRKIAQKGSAFVSYRDRIPFTESAWIPTCLSNRTPQNERVTGLLDDGLTLHLVYLDSVNHRFLLARLKSFGIDGAVLSWIKSAKSTIPGPNRRRPFWAVSLYLWLPTRFSHWRFTLSVIYKWSSRKRSVILLSGVPTISIKPPSLFPFCRLGLGGEIGPTKKPRKMFMPHRQEPHSNFSAADTDHRIPQITDVRDLGVPLDTTFTASANCMEAANTAMRLLFLVRRSFCELSKTALTPLYCALVQPHLEYAMESNTPTLRVDNNQLERV